MSEHLNSEQNILSSINSTLSIFTVSISSCNLKLINKHTWQVLWFLKAKTYVALIKCLLIYVDSNYS